MSRFVPLEKRSKKEQKEFHAKQRRSWEGISPVTRTVPNGKAYNRQKLKVDERRSSRDFRNETTAAFFVKQVKIVILRPLGRRIPLLKSQCKRDGILMKNLLIRPVLCYDSGCRGRLRQPEICEVISGIQQGIS